MVTKVRERIFNFLCPIVSGIEEVNLKKYPGSNQQYLSFQQKYVTSILIFTWEENKLLHIYQNERYGVFLTCQYC